MLSLSQIYKTKLPTIKLPYTGSVTKELNNRSKAYLKQKPQQLRQSLPTPQQAYNQSYNSYKQAII